MGSWENLKEINFLNYVNKEIVRLTDIDVETETFKPAMTEEDMQLKTAAGSPAAKFDIANGNTSKAFEWAKWYTLEKMPTVSQEAEEEYKKNKEFTGYQESQVRKQSLGENTVVWLRMITSNNADESLTTEEMCEGILTHNDVFVQNCTQAEKDELSDLFSEEQFQFTTMFEQKSDNTFRLYEAYQMLLMDF